MGVRPPPSHKQGRTSAAVYYKMDVRALIRWAAPREKKKGMIPMTPATQVSDVAAEQPILWLGMSGFAPDQRAVLEASLVRLPGMCRWRVSAFGDADAWWVNGAKVRIMPDGNLKVAAGLPTERALNLNLTDVDRPVAFATPLASADFEPRCTFDPVSEPSVHAVLLQFESWLWQVRAQFVLGAQIIERGPQLRHGVYHISHSGKLLAVLDFLRGKAAISPRVHPVDLIEARWAKRPAGAAGLPESFVHLTPGQLAWVYVRRTERDVLPARYRTETIYYRHVPGVPLRWLRDSQLMLLRELSAEPGTMQALRQRTGLSLRDAERDLACLYYAGSITTTRVKGAATASARDDSQPHSVGAGFESVPSGAGLTFTHDDLTAPVLLEPRESHRVPDLAEGA